jgi:excisionase family DNA binding protein
MAPRTARHADLAHGLRTRRQRQLLSRREAAELVGVSLTAVNKAIEQKAIRPVKVRRGVGIPLDEMAPLVVICRIGMPLPSEAKRRIRDWLVTVEAGEGEPRELALSEALIVRWSEEFAAIVREARQYIERRDEFLETDLEVKGGEPVIRGTRLTARAVLARLAGGDSVSDLAAEYPDIDPAAFEAAALYARTHPLRGRPPRPRPRVA